ncbi:MAG: peptidoglycan DD-metalloendopeptidase family protein [Bacteroidaceae bacterium]|nr:peptidoglycan DD-metalloendopeptidase family protein [Bacteroidaceae bacterium]
MKRVLLILLLMCVPMLLLAQSNKRIKELEQRRSTLQKQIAETEELLKTTNKNVGSQLNGLNALTGQIEERRRYIDNINTDLLEVDSELVILDQQLDTLKQSLVEKKRRYEASLKYLYKNHSIQEKLMFIFSAETLSQTYNRLRYVREYATYQRLQGNEIIRKQAEVTRKQEELQSVRDEKIRLLAERASEKRKLEAQEQQAQQVIKDLRSKQKGLQDEINKKRREANQLNNQIDKLIAIEIENARKRAEEEARREAAEAKKKAEEEAKAKAAENKVADASTTKPATTTPAAKPATTAKTEVYTMSKADRELSTDFASNRGKLPMPITTSYIIVSHYGQYNVAGLRNVTLDNKGIDIQGKPGAQARAVFSGKVAAVFQLNGLFNVLVRHGSYISVYCNLSKSDVKQGDDVSTRQILGTVYSDASDNNRTVLHFQLRREKDKLNPEVWLNK